MFDAKPQAINMTKADIEWYFMDFLMVPMLPSGVNDDDFACD